MPKLFQSRWFQFIVLVILVLLVAAPILTYPMGRDQGMYANIGRVILRGGTPFVDMWDIKPPPIYYIYAAGIGLFGRTTEAIRAIDLAFVPFGMLGLFMTGQAIRGERTGLFAAVLYGAFYFNDGFQNLSQSDSLATIPAIWAGYWTVRAATHDAGSRDALKASLFAGLICGILLWFKPQQYSLVAGAFVIYQAIQRLQTQHLRELFLEGTAFALGGLLTGGILLGYFWSQGIIAEIFIVAEGTASYNAQGYDPVAFIANMRQGLWFRWQVWHGLFLLAGVWFVMAIAALARKDDNSQESALLVLWLLAGLGFAFMQAKGFDTHWFPVLPPMAIMGALVIARFLDSIPQKLASAAQIAIVIAILVIPASTTWGTAWHYILGGQSQYDYWDTFQANDLKPEESLEVAQFLRERVQAGNSLFIWGFRPEVYFMADLWPATRYQAHFPLVAPWYPQDWRQNNVDILWAAMPPYVLVLEDDFMPWVTDIDADSHTILQDYTGLNNWLIANYERETEFGDFIVWRRSAP